MKNYMEARREKYLNSPEFKAEQEQALAAAQAEAEEAAAQAEATEELTATYIGGGIYDNVREEEDYKINLGEHSSIQATFSNGELKPQGWLVETYGGARVTDTYRDLTEAERQAALAAYKAKHEPEQEAEPEKAFIVSYICRDYKNGRHLSAAVTVTAASEDEAISKAKAAEEKAIISRGHCAEYVGDHLWELDQEANNACINEKESWFAIEDKREDFIAPIPYDPETLTEETKATLAAEREAYLNSPAYKAEQEREAATAELLESFCEIVHEYWQDTDRDTTVDSDIQATWHEYLECQGDEEEPNDNTDTLLAEHARWFLTEAEVEQVREALQAEALADSLEEYLTSAEEQDHYTERTASEEDDLPADPECHDGPGFGEDLDDNEDIYGHHYNDLGEFEMPEAYEPRFYKVSYTFNLPNGEKRTRSHGETAHSGREAIAKTKAWLEESTRKDTPYYPEWHDDGETLRVVTLPLLGSPAWTITGFSAAIDATRREAQ